MATAAVLHLQDRDIAMLSELGEVAVLDTETIRDRHFPKDTSYRACRRRLRLFKAHGLIQTLHISVVRSDRPGRMPALHRLTPEGAEMIEMETGVRPLRSVRSEPPKPNTLLHRLGMARVVLTVNDSCQLQGLPSPKWILEYDSHPNVGPNAKLRERYVLCREFPNSDGSVRRCWPDAGCLLTIPHQGKQSKLAILWEYDRSTETRSQLQEKTPGYESLLATAAWRKFFPDGQGVRIFVVVPSRQRLATVTEALRESPIAGHVRIAVASDLKPATFATAPIWVTTTGELRPLLASSMA